MIRSSGNGGTLPGGVAHHPGRRDDERRDPRAGRERAFDAQRGFAEAWAGTGEFARRNDRGLREREAGDRPGGREGARTAGREEGATPDAVRDPVPGLSQEHDRGGDGERRRDGERLLAVIEPDGPTGPGLGAPAMHATVRPDAVASEAATGDPAARVEALTTRIEAAFRVEIALGAAPPHVLRIPLAAAEDGVGAVTVTLDSGSVEIRLVRDGGSACEALAEAAQALAHRLGLRFPGCGVRVIEVVSGEGPDDRREGAPGDAAPRLSDLLGGRGR